MAKKKTTTRARTKPITSAPAEDGTPIPVPQKKVTRMPRRSFK